MNHPQKVVKDVVLSPVRIIFKIGKWFRGGYRVKTIIKPADAY